MEDQYSSGSNRGSSYRGSNYRGNNYRPRSNTNDGTRPRPTYENGVSSNYRGSRPRPRPRPNTDDNDGYQSRPSNRYDNDTGSGSYQARPRTNDYRPRPRYSSNDNYQPRSTSRYSNANDNYQAPPRDNYQPRTENYQPRPRTDNYQPRPRYNNQNRYDNNRGGYQNQNIQELTQTFANIVTHRYRQDINCLDLSGIAQEPLIKSKQIDLFDAQSKAMPALIKYLADTIPKLETLNLSQNAITNTACLYTLETLPNLVNLSLQGTGIRFYTDLDHMNAPKLKNLLLKDTPLHNSEMTKGGSYYQDEILKRFPSLKILDDVQIKGIEFDVPANVFPVTILPSFVEPQHKDQVYDFIGKYFNTIDTNRNVLQQIYTSDAYFSIQLNKPKNALMNDYAQYSQISRNLKFNKDSSKRFNAIFYGNEIGPALMMIPGTIHTFLTDPTKIMFDAYYKEGIMIVVHSEFQDLSTSLIIGFDRLFLLTDDFKIKSDMLTIRDNFILPLTKPLDLTSEQYELVLQFIKDTGMNFEFALMCLKEHMFIIDKAKETFIKVKNSGQLPPDAFSI